MKKLNREGFTLIELLAVIVVLAIVLVVTIPSVISSMNSAKFSQLHNLSVSVAQWYDKAAESDKLGLDDNILGKASPENLIEDKWYYLDAVGEEEKVNIAEIYGLNSDDIYLGSDSGFYPGENEDYTFEITDDGKIKSNGTVFGYALCSCIRMHNGKAQVLLVALNKGKFDTNGKDITYSFSFGTTSYDYVVEYLEEEEPPESIPTDEELYEKAYDAAHDVLIWFYNFDGQKPTINEGERVLFSEVSYDYFSERFEYIDFINIDNTILYKKNGEQCVHIFSNITNSDGDEIEIDYCEGD